MLIMHTISKVMMNTKVKLNRGGFTTVEAVLILFVLIAIALASWFVWSKQQARKTSTNTNIGTVTTNDLSNSKKVNFVTSAPFDISQMQSVSKFRSCSGHDYSGLDINGATETNRSMKNYAVPLHEFNGTSDKVKVIAPFDATVLNNSPGKMGDNLDLVPAQAPGYIYELGHIASLKNLTKGNHVKSGQLLGYYAVEAGGSAFDLQLWFGGTNQTINTTSGEFDSLFAHLSPDLAKQLAAHGLTADNLIVSKAERDANPCVATGQSMGVNAYTSDPAKDFVTITP
jgi:hypothetical protein